MTLQVVPGWLLVAPAGVELWRVTGCARRSSSGDPVAWRVGSVVLLAVDPGPVLAGGLAVRGVEVVAVVLEASGELAPAARVDAALDRELGRGAGLDPEPTPGGAPPARSPVPPAGTSPLAPTDVVDPPVLPPSGKADLEDPESQSMLSWVTQSQAGSRLRSELGKLERDRGVAMWSARMKLNGPVSLADFLELRENVLSMPLGPPLHERIKAAEELGEAVEDELAEE